MRNGIKFLTSLLFAMLFAIGIGSTFGATAGVVAFGASALVKVPAGVLPMAVTPEIWTDYIVGNLFKNNEFLLQSIDESQYVLQGKVVHVPNAGAPSKTKRNRTQLPATITRRTDVDVVYALDEFTTDPRFISNADKVELDYDKMESCMSEDMDRLSQTVADTMLYHWRPTYFIKASKTKSADFLIHGTGVRTGVSVDDFVAAKKIFNKWSIPKNDRFVILNSEMYAQLCDDVRNATNEHLMTAVYDPKSGRLEKLESFTIIERATVLLASNSTLTQVTGKQYFRFSNTDLIYSPEDYENIEGGDKNPANTSCAVGIFWQKNAVRRALGNTEMFDDEGNPVYYGDIYSFLQRAGGRKSRGDAKGVLGIIQEYSAA